MSEHPLFAGLEAAQARGELGAARAAEKADRLDGGWRGQAMEAIRAFARTHERFLAEDVRLEIPAGADPRAAGAIFQAAKRAGLIRPDGFAPACSSNGSPKVRWLSLILEETATNCHVGTPAGPSGKKFLRG